MMSAKYWLRQVRFIDRRIDREMEQISRLRAKLEAGRLSNLNGMPRGGSSDWTDTADRLIELEAKLNRRLRDMCDLKTAAIDAIDALPSTRQRDVLSLYYLNGMTWEQVAEELDLDVRWVYRLHGRALREIKVPEDKDH